MSEILFLRYWKNSVQITLFYIVFSIYKFFIDWNGSDILLKDNIRRIRESIWIQRKGDKNMNSNLMNADEGAYLLNHFYDQLLHKADIPV